MFNRSTCSPTDLPFLPRLGFQLTLPEGYEQFTWYGRGPHENYSDRNAGAPIGIYSGSVDDQYVPYIVPEENGNKTEVRWVALTNPQGTGLLAVGDPLLEVSAHHFTTENLTTARHTASQHRRDLLEPRLRPIWPWQRFLRPRRLEKYQPRQLRLILACGCALLNENRLAGKAEQAGNQ
jgi:hypothetical protein